MAQFILGFIFGVLVATAVAVIIVRKYKCQIVDLMNKISDANCAKKSDDCGCS